MMVSPIKGYDNNSGNILNIGVLYQLMPKKEIILILENIRSVYNVGAIFRTADATSVSKIYLIGTTATPIDRFGRERSDLHKAALGAEKSVDWEYVDAESSKELVQKLKSEGYVSFALEQGEDSVKYTKGKELMNNRACVVVGNEVDGVSKEVLSEVDYILEIPMKGEKESLNVSVAAGVLLYDILN
jgi:23S rRNA (guanosine2251-2'-O)-methyltransferase